MNDKYNADGYSLVGEDYLLVQMPQCLQWCCGVLFTNPNHYGIIHPEQVDRNLPPNETVARAMA